MPAARAEWDNARAAKTHIRALLGQMASGIQRCMYCEDSLGTDIDHFEPIALAPLRAFDWLNRLLACSHCNSNHKRDVFPRSPDGLALFVDPSSEDPADHLTLLLASGTYEALTAKGRATIDTFALNRPDLVQGRQVAYHMAGSALRDWHLYCCDGEPARAAEVAQALSRSPFAIVLRTMCLLPQGAASAILDARTLAALDAWRGRPVPAEGATARTTGP